MPGVAIRCGMRDSGLPLAADTLSQHPDQGIEARLLYAAYQRKPLNVLMTLIVMPVGVVLLWPLFPTPALTAWALAILVVSLLGYVECAAFKWVRPGLPLLLRWRIIFTVQTVLGGLAWALGPTLLMWQAGGAEAVLFVGILLCVCAVAMTSISEQRTAMQGFILATLVPPAVAALRAGGRLETLVAMVLLAGMVTLIVVGRNSHQTLRSLIETQSRVRAILNNALDAVIGMDGKGRITDWNARAQAIFGWTGDEVLGLALDDAIIAKSHRTDYQEVMARLMTSSEEQGVNRRIEMVARHHSGKEFPVELAITRLTMGDTDIFTAFIADISERKAAQDRLMLFRRIFDASARCVVVTDGNGHGIYQNLAHAQELGYSDEEIIGQDFVQALPQETAQAMATNIRQAMREGNRWVGQLPFQRKDGSRFISASNIGAIKDERGRFQYIFNIFTDFSEELARRNELSQARDTAERANHAKSDFLSSMSHELRTPMNAILGFAQMLEYDATLNADQQDNVHEILKGGHHLLKLINEVLDLAKIESGHINLSLEPVNLAEALGDCWQLIQPLAQARAIAMHVAVSPHMAVRADRMRFKQVMLNLLSNAVKYNRAGGTIHLAVESVAGDTVANGRLRITVTDTGAGIAADRIVELFQAFNRLGAEHSDVEGTGIGLTITRRLMELMGGQVGVDSQVGVGTTFWIELPSETTTTFGEASSADVSDQVHDAPTRQYRVLCVDDNPVNIKLFAQMLGMRRHINLITAHTPGLGIELAQAHLPELILLDINMPGLDGYEVLAVLKADDRLKAIPVIAVTANAMPRDIERGRAAGFADYLTKPIDVGQFLQAIDRCLSASEELAA